MICRYQNRILFHMKGKIILWANNVDVYKEQCGSYLLREMAIQVTFATLTTADYRPSIDLPTTINKND